MRSLPVHCPGVRVALRSALVALAAAVIAMVWTGPASAEPYMTVREGYKCSQCHVNKSGGGARTDYGRVYAETRLAASPGPVSLGGNPGPAGEVGYGRVSPFFSVGADLRTAFTYTDFDHASPTSQFNRPNACESCHASTGGGGKLGEVYMKLEAVPDLATIVYSANVVPTTNTREIYAILDKSLPLDGYLKVGTFRLPSGFQNTWDYPFNHADQGGYGLGSGVGVVGMETVRAKGGFELGIEPGPLAFSVSLSNPDDTSKETRGSRAAANGYVVSKWGVLGLGYTTDPIAHKVLRTTTEGYLGISLGRFTALGQIDSVTTKDDNTSTTTKMQSWLGEVDFLIAKGHNLRLLYEALDPDLDTSNDRRDRTSLIYEPFLTPYLQGRVGYRQYAGPLSNGTTVDKNGMQVFAELHFLF